MLHCGMDIGEDLSPLSHSYALGGSSGHYAYQTNITNAEVAWFCTYTVLLAQK